MALDTFDAGKYQEKPHAYPSTDNGYEKKDEAWFLKVCKSMYSDYVRDKGGIPYSRRHDFNLLRLYGEGNQPVEKYMNVLDPEQGEKTGSREGYMNISWDIVSVAPKFRRIINSKMEKLDMDFQAHAISPTALKEKESVKWNLWAESQMKEFFDDMRSRMGVESQSPEFLPENMEELELFMEERFKLKQELAIENAVEYSLYLSNFQEIKRRMIDDFYDVGIAACQDYVDPIDGKVKIKYLDPARLILRYSREKNFANIDYWGNIEEMTISELRARTGWEEEKIRAIAKLYNTWADNPTYWNWSDYYSIPDMNQNPNMEMPYDNYRVQVMFAEVVSANTDVYKMKKVNDGSTRTFKEKSNYRGKSDDKKQVEAHKYQMTYQGFWILATDYIFEFGKPYCIPRQDKKRPKLSLNVYKYAQKSLVSTMVPFLDGFQLAWLKLQNAIAMAAPAGLSIEMGTLENISIGGNKMTPLEILTIRRKTGDLIYKATTHHSQVNGIGGRPVDELSGGVGAQLSEYIQTMEFNLNMIRELTGLNEFMDASAPNPNIPVRSGMAAVDAGNNSLGPIMSGYFDIKDSACRKIALRYQVLADNGDMEEFYPALGKNVVQTFKLSKDVAFEDYAIVMRSRPSDEMKEAVRQAAMQAVQLGPKNGGIKQSDYLFIEDQLQNGAIKYARIYLGYKEKKYQKEAEQLQIQNMQLNSQTMQQQEQVKAQGEAQLMQGKMETDIQILQTKSQLSIQEEMVKHENRMKEIELQNRGGVSREATRGMSVIEAQNIKNQKPTKDGRTKD